MTLLSRSSTAKRTRRQLRFEPLEPRLALATLGLGIRVLEDNGGTPGAPRTAPLVVGQTYWVEVLAQDIRVNTPQGIIALPLNLSWDSQNLELLNPPTALAPTTLTPASLLTADFPLDRFASTYLPLSGHTGFVEPPGNTIAIPTPSIGGLRGAALPNANVGQAIGDNPSDATDFGFFSRLQFRALTAGDDTPFTIQIAGSMSFADADVLSGVAALSSAVLQTRTDVGVPLANGQELAVTEFIQINAPEVTSTISLSGFVYADTNLNGIFDTSAGGVPTEFGLPNVEIKLFQGTANTLVATTTTGPDGWYHFENLAAGTYRIVETQPARYVNSLNSLGTIVAPANAGGDNPPNLASRRGVVGDNQFSNIVIRGAEHGINYNFGENLVPTKNSFRSRTVPRIALNDDLGVVTQVVNSTANTGNINVQVTPDEIVVTQGNAAPQFISRSAVDVLVVNPFAGQEVIVIGANGEAETAQFLPGLASLRVGSSYAGTSYGLLVTNSGKTTMTAGEGGTDLAVLRDTPLTNDSLTAQSSMTSLVERLAFAMSFDKVRAVTTAPNGTEDDTASVGATDYLLELVGNWREI